MKSLDSTNVPDVCSISPITKEIERSDGETEFIGGPAYYFSLALKRLGTSIAVITKLAEKDLPILEELRKEKIKLYVGKSECTSSFVTVYGKSPDERYLGVMSVSSPFELPDIKIWPKKFFHLSPMTTEDFSIDILRKISQKRELLLDVGGFIREVRGDRIIYVDWVDKEEGLACAKILKVDRHEGEVLTQKKNIEDILVELSTYGPREVILTSNEGVHIYTDEKLHFSPFVTKEIKGRPGRGDTCMAAYVHGRLRGMSSARACKFTAAATSLKLSYEGPFRGSEKQVIDFMEREFGK